MPDMQLSPAEAFDLANFVLGQTSYAGNNGDALDAALITAGREHFAALSCANCHELPDPLRPTSKMAQPLATVDASRGCLSGKPGAWPHYALTMTFAQRSPRSQNRSLVKLECNSCSPPATAFRVTYAANSITSRHSRTCSQPTMPASEKTVVCRLR